MADYIYLLQTRLTPAQQKALDLVREAARSKGMTVFLVGGAVRDLTSGSPVRDLDVAVQGNALKLRKDLQHAKLNLVGESDTTQSLYFTAPGGVRLEVASTLSITYPKPGKPVAKPANILDDLRRRDFTANAMAISLNEGSFGLLMDPLNGVADIENRELRLVSPYGFIEDPARMIRASRLSARLGWYMEEKTQQRYDTGKTEHYIAAMSAESKGYELEEIVHEEDPLRVLRRLESEGWMKLLYPAWSAAKANESELNRLRDTVGQLEAMGLYPDPSAAYFPLLTAKLAPKDTASLKKLFPRQGFVDQIAALDAETKDFTAKFTNKAVAAPSDTWKLLMASVPEHILWLAHTSKSAPVQSRLTTFFTESAQARQRIPYQTMQEMRIVPELSGYDDLVEKLFFAIMDKKLETPEATKAFLEPFSPPAPPPPVNMRRRAVKRDPKPAKPRSKKAVAVVEASAEGEQARQATTTTVPVASAKPAKAAAIKPIPVKHAPAKVASVKAPAKPTQVKKIPAKSAQTKKSIAKKSVKVVSKAVKAKPAPVKKPAPQKIAAKGAVVKKTQTKKSALKPVKKALTKLVKKAASKSKPKSRR